MVYRLGVLGEEDPVKKVGSVVSSWVGLEIGGVGLPYPQVFFESFPLFVAAFLSPPDQNGLNSDWRLSRSLGGWKKLMN